MKMELKVGDTVELKSGGPVMTVKKLNPGADNSENGIQVECVWFDNENKGPFYQEFVDDTLSLISLEQT